MSTPTAPSPAHRLTEILEGLAALDAPGKQIGKLVRSAIKPGTMKDALSGTPIGHSTHPLLTDVVIGTWTSANLLDVVGGRQARRGAERLIAIGMAAYAPTALSGVTDWADSELGDPGVRRVGLLHAASNAAAFGLYGASLAARRRGDHGRGVALAAAGAGMMTAGGYLGGHLAYVQGIGVDQTRFDRGPADWTATVAPGEVPEGRSVTTVVEDTPVMLHRAGPIVHALHDRCSHRGCSLAAGTIADGVVECSCHGSRFRLGDGQVLRGPATTPQPAFDLREASGKLEIRLRG